MKKQFVRTGAECFYDHQLLELLLFFSITQSDTNVIAHSLINRFGSVSGVFKASYDELMEVKGISEVSAQLLRLVAELSDLEHCRTQTESYVEGVEGMLEILKSEFYGKDKSEARIICADDSLGITEIISIDGDEIFENSHRIVSDILASGCSQAVIAVYRPDSEAYPTDEDKTLARYLRRTLKAYNIEHSEYVVIGRDHISYLFRQMRLPMLWGLGNDITENLSVRRTSLGDFKREPADICE